jgi:hypothetical protein
MYCIALRTVIMVCRIHYNIDVANPYTVHVTLIDLSASVLEQCLVEFGNKGWLEVGDRNLCASIKYKV